MKTRHNPERRAWRGRSHKNQANGTRIRSLRERAAARADKKGT